jgi:hypothetical protein
LAVVAMPAVTAVHEKVATHHQREETKVCNCAEGNFEDDDSHQRDEQTAAHNPDNSWNTYRTIIRG